MKTAICHLESASPYSQSRLYTKAEVPPKEKESAADYDLRNWRHHQHANRDGNVFIPPMAFKNCLMEAAQYLGEKIPGKRNATWTKHFTAGILCQDQVLIYGPDGKPYHKDKSECESYMCHADGKKGSGTRVLRTFPVFPQWTATATILVFDETITEDVFTRYLEEAGRFIGIGRFRPRNGGFYGRFMVKSVEWQ